MRLSPDSRKTMSTVLAALLVISVVPIVVMIGCTMDMSAMGGCSHAVEVFNSICGGTYMVGQQVAAVVASGFSAILFALIAVFMMAVLFFAPVSRSRAFVLAPANAPPPPEGPLGVRLTL